MRVMVRSIASRSTEVIFVMGRRFRIRPDPLPLPPALLLDRGINRSRDGEKVKRRRPLCPPLYLCIVSITRGELGGDNKFQTLLPKDK